MSCFCLQLKLCIRCVCRQSTVTKSESLLSLKVSTIGKDCCHCLFVIWVLWLGNTSVLWDWRLSASKGYSLKGYHKPIVAVDGEANTFQVGHDPWPHLTCLCFPYDAGDNWWKSQLLRVLSERGLCPDKAAQVLPAQGMSKQGETAMLDCREVWPLPGGQLALSLTCHWGALASADGPTWVFYSPLSGACRQELWFPVSYILYSLESFPSERRAITQSLLGVSPSFKGLTAK